MSWFDQNSPQTIEQMRGGRAVGPAHPDSIAMQRYGAPLPGQNMSDFTRRPEATTISQITGRYGAPSADPNYDPNAPVMITEPGWTMASRNARQSPAVVSNNATRDGALSGGVRGVSGDEAFANQVRQTINQTPGVNPQFVEDQVNYYLQKRHSGELTGAGVPADDGYWLMRAGQAAREDPASGVAVPGAGGGGLPSGYSLSGANNLASFSAPGLAAPWTQQFQRPDPNAISNTPAYQFRMGQGMDAIQKSAASKGTLLTGGTLKDLTGFAQGLASTEYDKEYGRDLGEYQMNQGTFYKNQNNAFDKLSGIANNGQQAASSYAANVGNLYQQGGALNAQNTLNQNQANQGVWGNLSDLVTLAGNAYNNRRKRQQPTIAGPGMGGVAMNINNPVGYDEGL